ncbi:MAG: ABC transporter substrate-binding protein [Eubacteriales bacterium]|jgi:spermidine/putrescine transport system substrate-binding protein
MKKTVWILCAILLLVTSLVGCGQSDVKKLYVYNWGTYIDNSVLRDFEKENNCKVVYENYASNEEMYYKLKSGNANYDVIFPSDYMIEKMIKEDMLLPLDKQNIPNLKNIDPKLLDIPFDPGNQYSIPYFWGTLGILYNTEKVTKPVDSWNILWDKEYAKKILMYDSQRDSVGIALILQGYSLNSMNQDELNKAYELLVEQKPLVLAYVNDQVIDMMIGNEADLAVVYSGDAVYCMSENEKLAYVVPKEGSNQWFDNVAIPATSQNKELAEKFIDYLCRDDIALKNTMEVGYTSANKNALEEASKEDDYNNIAYNPTDDILARCVAFKDVGEFITNYADIWTRVKAAQ